MSFMVSSSHHYFLGSSQRRAFQAGPAQKRPYRVASLMVVFSTCPLLVIIVRQEILYGSRKGGRKKVGNLANII